MKIVKSTNSVIHDVFWAYLSDNSVKDRICACVFKSRQYMLSLQGFMMILWYSRHS